MNTHSRNAAIVVILLLLMAVGAYALTRNNDDADESASPQTAETMDKDDAMEGDEAMMEGDDDKMDDDDGAAMEDTTSDASNYRPYTEAEFAAASDMKRVYFFHASWCPTCRAANTEFTDRPDEIPADVVIFKTDYDTETALKNRFNITYQHTFVQVDAEGNELAKWNGGDLAELKQNVI